MAGVALRGLGSVFFPPVCVHCRTAVGSDSPFAQLCARCASRLDVVRPPHCDTCGHPFYGLVEGERSCPHCEGMHPAFRSGCTAVLLKGPARSMVLELKYHRGLQVLSDMQRIFRLVPDLLARVRGAILIPVPLHPRKRRERGYNQSELLAECLAQEAGSGTRVCTLLQRLTDTQTQTAFDRRSRRRNLKNAFALAPGAAVSSGCHYILVDDVFTTGATLNSCAVVLRRAGFLNLDVVTFGHG